MEVYIFLAVAILIVFFLLYGGFADQRYNSYGSGWFPFHKEGCRTLRFMSFAIPLSIDLIGIGFFGMDYLSIFARPSIVGLVICLVHFNFIYGGFAFLSDFGDYLSEKHVSDIFYNVVGYIGIVGFSTLLLSYSLLIMFQVQALAY